MSQLPEKTRDAVLGNVGAIVSFRVGSLDATVLEREFGGAYRASEFTELGNHEILVKMQTLGKFGMPFRGKTLAPLAAVYGKRETIIRRSREKYGTARRVVEGKIERWLNI
jgi:hypothetical protein